MKETSLNKYQLFFEILELISSKRKKFKGIITPSTRLRETNLDSLDLPVRGYNCLRRAGCSTIGDVLSKYPTKQDVKRIRNCGEKSANEIFIHFMAYQYEMLSDKEKAGYLKKLLNLNGIEA